MLVLNPNLNEVIFMLGNVYYFSGQLEQAKQAYHTLSQRTPTDVRVWNNLGETCFHLKQYQEAIQHLSKTVSMSPGLLPVYMRLAECYDRTGNTGSARKLLEDLAKKDLPASDRQAIVAGIAQLGKKDKTTA